MFCFHGRCFVILFFECFDSSSALFSRGWLVTYRMQKLWPEDAAALLARPLYSRNAPVGRGVDAVQDAWERNSFAGFVTFASRCVAL